jgi:CheY-like chemotaxis protein
VLLARLLKGWGWRVVAAASGRAALRVASHCDFDVAVVDTALPDTEVLTLVPRLRALRDAPLIATTTALSNELRRYRAMPFHQVLLKPYALDELRDALATVVEAQDTCTSA